jgi:hypothetical protein
MTERLHLDDAAYLVYTGQENVPDGVIRVRVHPSVRVIRGKAFFGRRRLMSVEFHDGITVIEEEAFAWCTSLREILIPPYVRVIEAGAFENCSGLTTVILGDGLEEIEAWAFAYCRSIVRIEITPTVRAIKAGAFIDCSGLTTVILGDGLEEVRKYAFQRCRSLVRIVIPPAVRAIKYGAFSDCSGLTTVILGDGLEEIEACAFYQCTSLVRIEIPPAVRSIDETAFKYCSNLTTVRFCDEIEEFVSGESMRHWWNNGVHEKCLSSYCFFVRFNIPNRVDLVQTTTLQTNIHGMLERIPSISPEGLNAHFCSIDSKLSAYEGSTMLELAIWKSKIAEQTDGVIDVLDADMKMACRIDSLSMVDIIVPNVLSFLRGVAN